MRLRALLFLLLLLGIEAWAQGPLPQIGSLPRGGGSGTPVGTNVITSTNATSQFVTNLITSLDLWTNDVFGGDRVIRPVDQTRQVESSLIGTNTYAFQFSLLNTNNTSGYSAAGYVLNNSSNSAANGLSWGLSKYGLVSDIADGLSALAAGTTPAILGVAEGHFNTQIGLLGLSWAQLNNQTNIGVHARSTSAGKTGVKRVGIYAETMTDDITSPPANPPWISSVIAGDSRTTGDPLLTLSTNNGTYRFGVTAGGDMQQVNGAGTDKVMSSDSVGVGTWQVFPHTAAQTNNLLSAVSNNFGIFGQGHTNRIAMFTPNTNTVGDSGIQQTSTNLFETRTRWDGVAYTNAPTNTIKSEVTSETNWRGLDYSPASTVNGGAVIKTSHGSGYTDGDDFLSLMGWQFGATSPHTGQATGTMVPKAANYDVGSSSQPVGHVYASTGGFNAATATPGDGGQFGATSGGQRMGFNSDRTDLYDSGGSGLLEFGLAGGGVNLVFQALCANAFATPNVFLKGNPALAANIWQMGANNTGSTAPACTLTGPYATGADHAGGDHIDAGGPGTGAGKAGNWRVQTSEPAASSATSQTLKDRIFVAANPVTLTESTATLVFNVAVAASKHYGIKIFATTYADDGTNFQVVAEELIASAVNKAGTISTDDPTPVLTVFNKSSGTLTTSWTSVLNGNSVDIKLSAVSSLTQTTLKVTYRVEIDGDGTNVITPQ